MGVSRESVGLWLYGLDPPPLTQYPDQWEVQGPAGLFTHGGKDGGLAYFIGLNVQNAADPLPLVAILAHELAHVRLFEQLAGTEDQLEAERMTDLATVFLGLGLFTANSVILEAKGHNPWIEGAWSAVARLGHLVAPEYAYALAVFTWLRDERHPHWIGYLREDVKVPFERTLAYFERSSVSLERFQQTPPDA